MSVSAPLFCRQVLGGVSRALGYRTVDGFVSSHLDFLVAKWLGQRQKDTRYTLESFPYALLNHASLTHFYRSALDPTSRGHFS